MLKGLYSEPPSAQNWIPITDSLLLQGPLPSSLSLTFDRSVGHCQVSCSHDDLPHNYPGKFSRREALGRGTVLHNYKIMSASSTINNEFLKMLIVYVLFSQSLNTIDNHFLLKQRGLVCCICVCTYTCMCEHNLRSLRSTVVELKELSDKSLAFSLTLTPTSWGWSLWLVCLDVTLFLHP